MSTYLHGYIKRSGFHQGMALMILIVLGLGTWGWFMTIELDRIIITGAENASVADIENLAVLSVGEKIFNIDVALVSARIERHPWISKARISRLPTGTLRIRIEESTPVVLVLDLSGRRAFYLDREGVRLAPVVDRPYDVPIFRGYSDGFDETGETANGTVREFLRVLADDLSGAGDMISEVKLISQKIELRLEPVGNHGAVPVMLGSSEFEEKFERLHAFWYQVMLPGQEQDFGRIDLRYDSQIVVRSASP